VESADIKKQGKGTKRRRRKGIEKEKIHIQ
jgi:hypothetical protein